MTFEDALRMNNRIMGDHARDVKKVNKELAAMYGRGVNSFKDKEKVDGHRR